MRRTIIEKKSKIRYRLLRMPKRSSLIRNTKIQLWKYSGKVTSRYILLLTNNIRNLFTLPFPIKSRKCFTM